MCRIRPGWIYADAHPLRPPFQSGGASVAAMSDAQARADQSGVIIGLDPSPWDGRGESGIAVYDPAARIIVHAEICHAREAHTKLGMLRNLGGWLVLEMIHSSYGNPAGRELFGTAYTCGRISEAWEAMGGRVLEVDRSTIRAALCHTTRAGDPQVRKRLLDLLGAPGTSRSRGEAYRVIGRSPVRHEWSALALAVWGATAINEG